MLFRIIVLIKKEAVQLWRNKFLLAFVLLFPLWNLNSIANMVAQGIMHIPTAVFDQSLSRESRRLIGILDNSDGFDVIRRTQSPAELELLLRQGSARVGVIIPPDFSAAIAQNETAAVQVLLDGSETTTSLLAQAYLDGISQAFNMQMMGEKIGASTLQNLLQVKTETRVWFNESLRRLVFQLPGEIAGGVAILAVLLPAVSIVRERENGTLEQLFVTPLRSVELIAGKSIVTLAVTFSAFVGMLALTVLHFHVPLKGSLPLLLVLAVYYICIEMGWGLLISASAHTQGQGFLGAFFVVIAEVIFSGQILPVEYMPPAAQWLSHLTPNKYFTTIMREVALKNASLADLWPEIMALALLGLALYSITVFQLKKGLE